MSRRRKEFKLGKKDVFIEELRIADLIELFNLDSGIMLSDFKKIFYDFLPRFTNITLDDIGPLGLSEVTAIVDIFKEVNSDFFNALKSLGVLDYLNGLLKDLKNSALNDLSAIYAASSKKDT